MHRIHPVPQPKTTSPAKNAIPKSSLDNFRAVAFGAERCEFRVLDVLVFLELFDDQLRI